MVIAKKRSTRKSTKKRATRSSTLKLKAPKTFDERTKLGKIFRAEEVKKFQSTHRGRKPKTFKEYVKINKAIAVSINKL